MEQPIKAGMILKTKFTTAGSKKFMEYIKNKISRTYRIFSLKYRNNEEVTYTL